MVCARCRRGNFTLCPLFKATRLTPGGMAQRFAVPAENTARDVLPLPDTLSDKAATLIEPIGCILRGIDRSGLAPGDTVAIVGAGINGVLLAIIARLRGARRIYVSDQIASRRERALRMGADAALDPAAGDVGEQIRSINDGALADVVYVTPSKPAAALAGLALVEPGGNLLLYAPCAPGETIALEPHKVFFEEIRLTSTYSAGPHDTRLALDYLATGRIPGDDLVTHVFPLEQAQSAFDMAANPGEGLKAAIRLR
jgi:L-iditol 2-dehydrogenase